MRRFLVFLVLLTACARPHVRSALELRGLDSQLIARLDATDASTRSAAAFALGELGIAWKPVVLAQQVEAEARLVDRLGRERDDAVRVEIIAALGRVGRSRGRSALLVELTKKGPPAARAGLALSHLYRRLRDKELDPAGDLPALARALDGAAVDVRQGICAALSEVGRPQARALLRRELVDEDATCRTFAARGFATQALGDDTPLLEKALHDDDERVAAFSAVAIARLAERGIAPTLALDVLGRAFDSLLRPTTLLTLANAALVRPELAPLFAKLATTPQLGCSAALAHDRIVGKPELVEGCSDRDALVARLYAETIPSRVSDLAPLLALSRGTEVARAGAAAALGRYADARARARLIELCADPVPAVWGAAAEGATEAQLRDAGPLLLAHVSRDVKPDDFESLVSALNAVATLAPPHAVEQIRPLLDGTPPAVARAAQEALEKLSVHADIHPLVAPAPYDVLVVGPAPIARFETSRGIVRIQLDAARAPRTVRNLVGLVQKHFYDGLTFQRVVPGFVVQGGDPRGDGSGGPGWFIPCEPNPHPYREGSVGMALSGLDTGGSQLFIALLPLPHLEGRYTAFGDVIEGMRVVRALLPEDKILSASIE